MKQIPFLAFSLIILFVIMAPFTSKNYAIGSNGPLFEYIAKDNTIELDTIYLDEMKDVIELEVEFENKGDAPLIVNKVSGCCGTQVTNWTKKPLMPGEKGTITVKFREPPRPHKISRTVSAVTNAPGGEKKLTIKGVIAEQNDGSINLDYDQEF